MTFMLVGLTVGCEKELDPKRYDPQTGRPYTLAEIQSRPVDLDPLLKRLNADELKCYREATSRIKALGKPSYTGTQGDPVHDHNYDPRTGEMRWDLWAGGHLFALPEAMKYPSGGFPPEIPGIYNSIMLELPYPRAFQPSKPSDNPYRIEGINHAMQVVINCVPGRTLASDFALRGTLEKAWKPADKKSVTRVNDALGLYERASGSTYPVADYIPIDEAYRAANGSYIKFICDSKYPPPPNRKTSNCRGGILYRDGVSVQIIFRTAYLPHWRKILTSVNELLDESYRGN